MKLPLLALLTCLPCLALAQSQPSTNATVTPVAPAGAQDHQRPPHGPPDPAQILEHLTKALQLTSSQQDQIKPILEAQLAQMKSIHDDTSSTDDQKQEQMQALRQDTAKQIEAVLTPDQVTQFEQMHPPHRDK